ncbi:MAG: helix-turn-helix transcriptional regulator [Oscillospiraceae bacterium]|nr:helix-turn-helix transcriptional regulator [Oscillospiraceae bacterium]
MTLSERLKQLRDESHMKQEDIAKGMGIPLRTYCRYEYGEREPGVTALWRMADFYGVTTDYLIGRTDTK